MLMALSITIDDCAARSRFHRVEPFAVAERHEWLTREARNRSKKTCGFIEAAEPVEAKTVEARKMDAHVCVNVLSATVTDAAVACIITTGRCTGNEDVPTDMGNWKSGASLPSPRCGFPLQGAKPRSLLLVLEQRASLLPTSARHRQARWMAGLQKGRHNGAD